MLQRFQAKVERIPFHTCWEWTGALRADGYGVLWNPRSQRTERAHRSAYEHFVGPIPSGTERDCRACSTIRMNRFYARKKQVVN